MVFIVKLLSIIVVVFGCLVILRPDTLKTIFGWVKEGNRIYMLSVVRGLVGVFLILASPGCAVPNTILFFGALLLFSSIAIFLFKKSAVMSLVDWWLARPVRHIYIAGTVVLIIGAIIALAA